MAYVQYNFGIEVTNIYINVVHFVTQNESQILQFVFDSPAKHNTKRVNIAEHSTNY
jgi:hypothetical protein